MATLKELWWDVFRVIQRFRYSHEFQVLAKMPLFAPYSEGSPRARADLALQAADQTFPLIGQLLADFDGLRPLRSQTSAAFCAGPASLQAAEELKLLFNKYGSDKSSTHDYHFIYGHLLNEPASVTRVLEIGLGSNNDDVVSNMGRLGHPGASLRAFRDFLPNASVFGADIDTRVLFNETRIETYFVDQTDLKTFDDLGAKVGSDFDLIVDDGLHTINANLAVIIFGLPRLKAGGWLVVEDIAPAALPAWRVIASLMPKGVRCELIEALDGLMFLLQKSRSAR